MNPEPTDNDLRSHFAQQRRRDAVRVPSFARLSTGPTEALRQPVWRRLGTAAATAAVVFAATFFVLHRPSERARIDRPAIAEVMQWEAPSTFLLEPVWQTASVSNQPPPTDLQP